MAQFSTTVAAVAITWSRTPATLMAIYIPFFSRHRSNFSARWFVACSLLGLGRRCLAAIKNEPNSSTNNQRGAKEG